MAETITIKKEDFGHLQQSLLQSLELIEEIEFQQGIKLGREQFKAGAFHVLQ